MISKLKLNRVDKNRIQVLDKSEYDYSNFSSKFLYENTISINYLLKVTSDDINVIEFYISEHDGIEETVFLIQKDGYYRINHLIIPTKDWLDKLDLENVVKFEKVYFYMDGNIYEYNFKNKQATVISPILLLSFCDLDTTIFSSEEDFMIIDGIKDCIINLANKKFANQNCNNSFDPIIDIRLDYAQMIYNLLDYYISCGNLLEAEIIFEDFSKCYNICEKTFNNNDCDCI